MLIHVQSWDQQSRPSNPLKQGRPEQANGSKHSTDNEEDSHGSVDGRTNGDGWMDEWMDGQTDGA